MTMAIVAVRPGMEPKMMPIKVPTATMTMVMGLERTSIIPCNTIAILPP